MSEFSIEGVTRKRVGKQLAVLRKEGKLPAVLYGHNTKPVSLEVSANAFARLYRNVRTSKIIDLTIDGGERTKVLIHAIQNHPLSGVVVHADFYKVNMDEKIHTEIPLHFIGESTAVKELGGILLKSFDHVEIVCFPGDLVSEIVVDIGVLATFDDAITIADLSVPKGIAIQQSEEQVVVAVAPPRTEEEIAALDEKLEENVEGIEVEEKGKADEGEEGEEGKTAGDKEDTSAEDKKE